MDIIRKPNVKLSRRLGFEVESITLLSETGASLTAMNYGGIIEKIIMPDRKGLLENILLSYDDVQSYCENLYYLNAAIGMTAGRIENGQLNLEGVIYRLERNQGVHHLHGGSKGLHHQRWRIDSVEKGTNDASIVFTYFHEHLSDGFPGNMTIKFRITLTEEHHVKLFFEAVTDRMAHINLTHHGYYNLSGRRNADVGEQYLFVNANRYYEIDDDGIPQMTPSPLGGTPYDFHRMVPIAQSYHALTNGIDHPFCLERPVAEQGPDVLYGDETSGRWMQLSTNQNAVVIYTNNGDFKNHRGICFETQAVPNTVVSLMPGETYCHETVMIFASDFDKEKFYL
ncbi:galactose mutarotase [Fusibacter paucivorans]|uniref:Galactose mutarotase n=1 Tax=Fusibacter paucivorans TaxID=76009 RepID=A0ABS5PRK9_9FIRM|nr:aldose epimerase family protein [Fusibacter paucivorans]MBS7527800.1 galactose mutarotase [Fusibacter paucivorans]